RDHTRRAASSWAARSQAPYCRRDRPEAETAISPLAAGPLVAGPLVAGPLVDTARREASSAPPAPLRPPPPAGSEACRPRAATAPRAHLASVVDAAPPRAPPPAGGAPGATAGGVAACLS